VNPLFLDIETADDKLLCTGYAFGGDPVDVSWPGPTNYVLSCLADPDQVVACHSTYDIRFLRMKGANVQAQLHDTKVLAWLLNENTGLSLEEMVNLYLGMNMDKRLRHGGKLFEQDDGKLVPLPRAPRDQVERYCKGDVNATRALYNSLLPRLKQEGLEGYFVDTAVPLTRVLLDMECRGLPIDVKKCEALGKGYTGQRDTLERLLKTGLPDAFNVRSNPLVKDFLTKDRVLVRDRIPTTMTPEERKDAKLLDKLTRGGAPIDPLTHPPGTFVVERYGRLYESGHWVVQGLDLVSPNALTGVDRSSLRLNSVLSTSPWVGNLLEFRKLDKLLGTYIDKFQRIARNGRIYGRFNQTGTVTGRLSSSDPNLQNIPSRGQTGDEVRGLFTGNLVVGDFSQLEPRLMAHFSEDPELMKVFAQRRDLYKEVGAVVMPGADPKSARQIAKVYVLAMGYGAGADKLAELLRLNGFSAPTREVKVALTRLQKKYHVYFEWREATIARSRKQGFVQTLEGRYRRFPTPAGSWGSRHAAVVWKGGRSGLQAANAVIQGSAADIMNRVMIHTSKMFPQLRLLAQVHDELVWEYDPATPPVLADVETWVTGLAGRGLRVPLEFKPHFGRSWEEGKAGTMPVVTEGIDLEEAP
jgi:DNA polymerase I-like protein with 3'-5' exonuclease and polymerase domains